MAGPLFAVDDLGVAIFRGDRSGGSSAEAAGELSEVGGSGAFAAWEKQRQKQKIQKIKNQKSKIYINIYI